LYEQKEAFNRSKEQLNAKLTSYKNLTESQQTDIFNMELKLKQACLWLETPKLILNIM
jgi:hypothetical protein